LQIAYYHPGNQWVIFPWYLCKLIPAGIDIEVIKH
jgi:hypothetical protein